MKRRAAEEKMVCPIRRDKLALVPKAPGSSSMAHCPMKVDFDIVTVPSAHSTWSLDCEKIAANPLPSHLLEGASRVTTWQVTFALCGILLSLSGQTSPSLAIPLSRLKGDDCSVTNCAVIMTTKAKKSSQHKCHTVSNTIKVLLQFKIKKGEALLPIDQASTPVRTFFIGKKGEALLPIDQASTPSKWELLCWLLGFRCKRGVYGLCGLLLVYISLSWRRCPPSGPRLPCPALVVVGVYNCNYRVYNEELSPHPVRRISVIYRVYQTPLWYQGKVSFDSDHGCFVFFTSYSSAQYNEESMSEVLGFRHSHEAWHALEVSFSHRSKTRELQLNDELQLMHRGSQSIAEFSRTFKGLCNQLAAIGCPIDDTDKVHWYLRALGPDYKIFSTIMMSQLPLPSFVEIVPKALSHEIFERSVSHSSSNSAYFVQQTSKVAGHKQVKHRSSTSPTSFSNSKSSSNSSVHCQLCDKEGHLAKRCWNFLKLKKKQSANLAEAFFACSI
ncbi:hypothetical protein CK203_000220 [Vitis vinifera]|uniref:CCHC-type domain-containing protein n=1 Tax=Vitis vinifera TaxID=29760 RepID=A0A438KR50_VITVI|nr:hypothetical protein CK203_000220 [Vitis vinifera]